MQKLPNYVRDFPPISCYNELNLKERKPREGRTHYNGKICKIESN